MGLTKFIKKLKRRANCMLDGNTIVHVLGTIDMVDNMWDFSEVCTLDESLSMAINRFKEKYIKDSNYYAVRVCYGIDCLYTIDNFGFRISKPYKDIISFKNLDLSDIDFEDNSKYKNRTIF